MPRAKAGLGVCPRCKSVKILYRNSEKNACKLFLNASSGKAKGK